MAHYVRGWFRVAFQLLALLWLGVGCAADPKTDRVSPKVTGSAASKPTGVETPNLVGTDYLSVGDKVRITYSDIPSPIPPTDQQIPESKKITLHLNLEVEFVGKNKAQLEREIRDLYISKGYYKNIKIDIDVPLRTFYVEGEVRNQGIMSHQANLTLTKAIAMAGGFTEYAKKRDIKITRADGAKLNVNWSKAAKDPQKDPLIHPGDRIHVDKTPFF